MCVLLFKSFDFTMGVASSETRCYILMSRLRYSRWRETPSLGIGRGDVHRHTPLRLSSVTVLSLSPPSAVITTLSRGSWNNERWGSRSPATIRVRVFQYNGRLFGRNGRQARIRHKSWKNYPTTRRIKVTVCPRVCARAELIRPKRSYILTRSRARYCAATSHIM